MPTEASKAKRQFRQETLNKMRKVNPGFDPWKLKLVAKQRTNAAVKQFEEQRNKMVRDSQAAMKHDNACICKHPACPGTKAPAREIDK